MIEFLAENRVGVTISIDGPKEVQDQFRVFHNGTGSYEIGRAEDPRTAAQRHRTRPIGARVTLTSQNPRYPQDLPPPARGDRLLGGRVRAGDDGAEPEYAIAEAGFDTMLRPVPLPGRASFWSMRWRTGITVSPT